MADRTVQTSQTAFEWPATGTPSVPYQQRHEGRRAGNHDVAVPLQHRPNPDARSPRRTTARSVGIKISDAPNRAGDKIEDDGGEEGQEGRSPRGWLANEHVLVPAQCEFSGVSHSNILMGVSAKVALRRELNRACRLSRGQLAVPWFRRNLIRRENMARTAHCSCGGV